MEEDIRDAIEGAEGGHCPVAGARLVVYAGTSPKYHEGGGEHCGVTVRYAISTPFTE
jgi:hypothetical protein